MTSLSRRRFAVLFASFLGIRATVACAETTARKIAPTSPVHQSDDPVVATMLRALADEESVALYYHGGSSPGVFRRFRPISVYRITDGGVIYAHGHCQLRNEPRTLRLDRTRLA